MRRRIHACHMRRRIQYNELHQQMSVKFETVTKSTAKSMYPPPHMTCMYPPPHIQVQLETVTKSRDKLALDYKQIQGVYQVQREEGGGEAGREGGGGGGGGGGGERERLLGSKFRICTRIAQIRVFHSSCVRVPLAHVS